jgi:hypothetical protein
MGMFKYIYTFERKQNLLGTGEIEAEKCLLTRSLVYCMQFLYLSLFISTSKTIKGAKD